ncbi:MAG: Maf family protein [Hydrogenobacter sp.]|mgnify:CR=1 FL=1|uniref:Maf family protein n=1 Tax=Hydrogenobacter thermophilus TaxID=940 RepID=UPI0030F950E1
MKLLILASESKRRVDILRMLGFKFLVIPSGVKEDEHANSPLLTARSLAFKKSFTVWKEYKYATVIGADTLVVLSGKVLGKPKDAQEAKRMLSLLSGRWHKVITAVCVISQGKRILFHDVSFVKFRCIGRDEIEKYVLEGEPMDKAGAYAVQGFGATFVEKIVGDFYTVMGLPASKTYKVLRDVLG